MIAYEATNRLTYWHSEGGSSNVEGKEKRGLPNLMAHNARPIKKAACDSQGGRSRPPNYGKNVAKKFPLEKTLNVNPFKPKGATMKKKLECFICQGDHFARDFPFKGQIHLLVKASDDDANNQTMEAILHHQDQPNQNGPNRLYLCQWKGKPTEENSWQKGVTL